MHVTPKIFAVNGDREKANAAGNRKARLVHVEIGAYIVNYLIFFNSLCNFLRARKISLLTDPNGAPIISETSLYVIS